MLFHPQFRIEKEQRLIFGGPGAAAAPAEGAAVPPAAETLTKKQQEIKAQIEKIAKNPDAAGELVNFQVQKTEEDIVQLQERYKTAIVNAANAYQQSLITLSDTDSLAAVNEAFKPANVEFQVDDSGKLVISAGAPEEDEEEEEKSKLSPEDEKLVNDFLGDLPQPQRQIAEKVVKNILDNPRDREGAKQVIDARKNLSPKAKEHALRNTAAILNGKLPQNAPPDIQRELDAFERKIGPEGKEFLRKLGQGFLKEVAEEANVLSKEERGNILDGARQELKKFDVTKASEIDKNILLARLQMRGIDTSNGAEILQDPSKMKVFEGSPMERGFNQIMGLIGYILLSIQKMKDAMHPGEKNGAETAAGDKGKKGPEAPSPEKEALRQKLKEQAKSDGKSMTQFHGEKQNQLDEMNKKTLPELRNKIQEIHDANEEAGLKDEDNEELKTRKAELQTAEKEAAGLQTEVTEMDAMKKEAGDSSNELNQKQNIVSELLQGLPNGEQKNKLIEALKFKVEPNAEYQLVITPAAGIDLPAVKNNLNAVLSGRLAQGLSEAVHFDGDAVLKSPAEMGRVFDALAQSIREDISKKNNPPVAPAAPAPAPAVAPPAAPAPAPAPAGPASAAPSASAGAGGG
ncbi:MAG: hypothetical protein PHX87_00320 [Candidatus Peribacteraceae bacterium]|nr:hypothetical protein [Candidatus Peribacteraceae bacterium]MDD5741853.1 hypothetical protein [Candidatus Peribacteraceae bacterium]